MNHGCQHSEDYRIVGMVGMSSAIYAHTLTQFVIASAQRRGDLAAVAAFPAPTRLPRSARNDSSNETGYA